MVKLAYFSVSLKLIDSDVRKASMATDHYSTLGVPRSAFYTDIKAKYFEVARKLHPDRNLPTSSKKLFLDLNNAYVIPSDRVSRIEHDRFLGCENKYVNRKYASHYKECMVKGDDYSLTLEIREGLAVAGMRVMRNFYIGHEFCDHHGRQVKHHTKLLTRGR